jgi:hypothetical protein
VLREVLSKEITLEIFRHYFDPIVPDHLLIAEHCPLGSIQRWMRGLDRLPKEFFLDPYYFGKICPIIFDTDDTYYTAIEINLSNPYRTWKKFWSTEWKRVGGSLNRVLLHITGLNTPHLLALAEIAVLFSASNQMNRTHQNPLVLAKGRESVLSTSAFLESEDCKPDQHILLNIVAGMIHKDSDATMLDLISKMVEIG